LTTIGKNAFAVCDNLAFIILPNTVTTIRTLAFQTCLDLESIIFPSSVETYGKDILGNCISLERVYLANDSGQQQVDVAYLGVDLGVVSIYRDLSFDGAWRRERLVAEFGADSDFDEDRPPNRGASRSLAEAFESDSDSDEDPPPNRGASRSLAEAFESDSDSDDEPPNSRARTSGKLYNWTGGKL
jgi:hypothetical protein